MNKERRRFLQQDKLDDLRRDRKLNEMLTVYESDTRKWHNHRTHCALIPSKMINRVLSDSSWDLHHGEGVPGSVISGYGRGKSVKYLRYGNSDGIEPLVICRNFSEIQEDYVELSEEFRLFHNLYHDRKTGRFIKIDDDGEEQVIAYVKPHLVEVRLREIRQFLSIKEMYISIQFDYSKYSNLSLSEMNFSVSEYEEKREGDMLWFWCCGEIPTSTNYKSFSHLLGKCLYGPLPKSKSGLFGFDESEKKYEEFVIDLDEDGNEVRFTSNPDMLANYFGANPHAPNYLTPVHFYKEVLDKYHQHSSKYTVEPSLLRCGSLWALQMDNHHEDQVCAWLGDLGRSLPHREQLHWRAHNIAPRDSVSETFYRNQILAQPTDSTNLEHVFKKLLHDFYNLSQTRLGWSFLLQLKHEDRHHLATIRVPASNEQKEFDELILGLTKILVDSLNIKEMRGFISNKAKNKNSGSIDTLQEAFGAMGVTDYDEYVSFLRDLQNLRSSGSAHRKGKNYSTISEKLGMAEHHLQDVFKMILEDACGFLRYLICLVESGRIGNNNSSGSASST